MEQIRENVRRIRQQLQEAALRAGRDPKEVLLCAASKMNDAARVRTAVDAGVDCCGENRVQELMEKQPQGAYGEKPVHFIGHLQTNKVRQVVGKVDLIQSVDREPLLACIQQQAEKLGVCQDVLLEVNVGMEDSKSGFTAAEAAEMAARMGEFPNCRLRGLMAIPPICETPGGNYRYFDEMRQLLVDIKAKKYDNVSMEILSMGMSGDFEDAIVCGSTMIRIGTAIFGQRDYHR